MLTIAEPRAAVAPAASVFDSVLCGISGSRSDAEVVRQGAALAGREGRLALLAVAWEAGHGASAIALLSRRRAEDALRRAKTFAHHLGVAADTQVLDVPDAGHALVDAATNHDLVVVGPSGAGRVQGIAVGRTASVVLHEARGPVLVARRPSGDLDFPGAILLASDGSPPARHAAEIAARVAQVHGSHVALAAPLGRDAANRRELAQQAGILRAATGVDPVLLEEYRSPARSVLAAAPTWEASLIVIGSRGLRGLAALGSVSERVAHEAPCSVLVAR